MPGLRNRSSRAFTLVELLVVIGVIAVLIGILLPVLRRAREQANQLVCQSNLRQWGQAMLLYANQNNGWLPRRGQGAQPTAQVDRPTDWFNALPPVLQMKSYYELYTAKQPPRPDDGSLWTCPAALDRKTTHFFSYGMNMRLSTWLAPTPDRINRVGPWSTVVFMADAPGEYCSVLPSSQPYSPIARHRGRLNISFLDGHITSYTGAEIGVGVGEVQRHDVRWVIPNSVWSGPGN